MKNKIFEAVNKFNLDLSGFKVLTEAATGNYVVTPVIAAVAGANVTAFAKESMYGTLRDVKSQTVKLASECGVVDRIIIVDDLDIVDLGSIDILTNTGFLRPINRELIGKLSSRCVISLMWEPWEFREGEIDLDACVERSIKVYGTDENDARVRTVDYLGDIVLELLMENNCMPSKANILMLGCKQFTKSVSKVIKQNGYSCDVVNDYSSEVNAEKYNAYVVLEHMNPIEVIGGNDSFLHRNEICEDSLILHICGNISIVGPKVRLVPSKPAPFGYMSFSADYLDSRAVIDLHTAGLSVAEGMIKAGSEGLVGKDYREYVMKNYPALSFEDEKYW